MLPLADALGPWREFYTMLGTASATMVGLLFVAATVGAGVFSNDRRAALRVFLSASVVNFSLILAACLVVLAPVRSWVLLGVVILGCGLFGLAHSCVAWRDTLRDGLIKAIDLEDRVWYIVLPIAGYLFVAASGVTLALRLDVGCAALALSMGALLAVGLHNAWDITVRSITRRRE
ncbi:MAG TPA: hypothetical protein VND19_02670 [Acetobacteraceae bacterium]|nr:hypothetical protein [Acetobacteraceae bacterium]